MILFLCALVGVLVGLSAAGLVLAVKLTRQPPPPATVDRLLRESVVVTLKSGTAFTGVLWESDSRSLVLRSAVAQVGTGALPVDGELFLFAVDVAYIQKP